MNRRNFLKLLPSIPLIGIPVKLLANDSTHVTIFADDEHEDELTYFEGLIKKAKESNERFKNPYADVAEHIYKEYWNDSAEMNAAWMKRKS